MGYFLLCTGRMSYNIYEKELSVLVFSFDYFIIIIIIIIIILLLGVIFY
jgi:hypothetical protein